MPDYASESNMRNTTDLARLRSALGIEQVAEVQLLKRLGIEWPPGEPFLAVIEGEITRLRKDNALAVSELMEYATRCLKCTEAHDLWHKNP